MKPHKRTAKALATITPAQSVFAIETAIRKLADARDYLRAAGASNAADYVARALKSAHGARRHAMRRVASDDTHLRAFVNEAAVRVSEAQMNFLEGAERAELAIREALRRPGCEDCDDRGCTMNCGPAK